MKKLAETLTLRPKSKINSERASVIDEFVQAINQDREGTKYQPIKPRAIAIKVAHLKLPDLYYFLSKCKDYKGSFSKCFFGSLKIKK